MVFPDCLPDKESWGKSTFRVMRDAPEDIHPTLRAGGTTSAVTAYRMDGLVIDDPMDLKNNANLQQREKMWDNYEQTIFTRLVPTAFQIVIGTRWGDDDFIGRLLRQNEIDLNDLKESGWWVSYVQAEPAPRRSYWEAVYPFSYIEKELKEKKPALFALQYQGDTTGGESGIIRKVVTYEEKPEWFTDPRNDKKKDLLVASGWDTAYKKGEQNDFSVGYVGGLDQDGQIWILDRVKGRWGIPELAREMERLHLYWETWADFVEDSASGTAAIQTLMESAPDCPTEPVYYHGGKLPRGHALTPYLHGAHVLFPRTASWFEDASYNLLHFPYAPHDDDVDALFILVNNLLEVRHPSEYEEDRPTMELEFKY